MVSNTVLVVYEEKLWYNYLKNLVDSGKKLYGDINLPSFSKKDYEKQGGLTTPGKGICNHVIYIGDVAEVEKEIIPSFISSHTRKIEKYGTLCAISGHSAVLLSRSTDLSDDDIKALGGECGKLEKAYRDLLINIGVSSSSIAATLILPTIAVSTLSSLAGPLASLIGIGVGKMVDNGKRKKEIRNLQYRYLVMSFVDNYLKDFISDDIDKSQK